MKYGCIGEHLKHSFSKEIHASFADYEYEICEIERERLSEFMERADFLGINVTIPYKELVIPHLYYVDDDALSIGAVNTIVNRGGKLYGYNTDVYGMTQLIKHAGIQISDKKVVILGTGGTSKTACAVANGLGAGKIIRVSRTAREDAISYEELYAIHTDADVIINTTPSGMFPNTEGCPVQLSKFEKLTGVIDAVYNPLRTNLVLEAKKRGIRAEGGLYMLVAQAVRASEIFLGEKYPEDTEERVFREILNSKENVVLIGMPSSGKSTVGALVAKALGRETVDSDVKIRESCKMEIPEIFSKYGESHFRELERNVILEISKNPSIVVATGGGVPLNRDNMHALRQNGRIYFIDRSIELLTPTSDRPLSSDRAALEERYRERYPIYSGECDVKINGDGEATSVAEKILEDFKK